MPLQKCRAIESTDSVAHINAMAQSDLAMAYAGRAKKIGVESNRYVHYVMAAAHYAELWGVSPHESWLPVSELTAEQWQAAWQEALRIIAQGWEPMTATEIDADGHWFFSFISRLAGGRDR